jgi:hypothetical protein
MKLGNGNALLAWMGVIAFLAAAAWPKFFESELPLVGLRNLTAPLIGWPLALVTFALALFLSVPAWLSRDRLLICAGFCFCLFVVVMFYVSMVVAPLFFLIGVSIVRESRQPFGLRP